jgi:hypothetical protein
MFLKVGDKFTVNRPQCEGAGDPGFWTEQACTENGIYTNVCIDDVDPQYTGYPFENGRETSKANCENATINTWDAGANTCSNIALTSEAACERRGTWKTNKCLSVSKLNVSQPLFSKVLLQDGRDVDKSSCEARTFNWLPEKKETEYEVKLGWCFNAAGDEPTGSGAVQRKQFGLVCNTAYICTPGGRC